MGFFHLFGKKKKKRIVAFVDFEHWFYSMQNLYNAKPGVVEWFDLLSAHGQVVDCIFFADFSQPSIRNELGKIRAISNKIIETRNPNPKFKKDYTDFIMLDNIYQRAFQDGNDDIFVIFSGDGHFSSAVSFLKNYCSREVGIYGICGATSHLLKDAADWCVELPEVDSARHNLCEQIFSAIKRVESRKIGYVTFTSTVSYVSANSDFSPAEVRDALHSLMDAGLIRQETHSFSRTNRIKTLAVDWAKVSAAGYHLTTNTSAS